MSQKSITSPSTAAKPWALYALAIGAFGIGTSEFVIMGLLLDVSKDLNVSIFMAGLLVTGYALGVVIGAPILTLLGTKMPRKNMLLILMGIFTLGNLTCALAPTYEIMMMARIVTSLCHGAFFGIGSVVATSVVPKDKQAFAISLMFTGLTIANILGVPAGTWIGQAFGWRATFWGITAIGPIALIALSLLVPKDQGKTSINIADECRAVFKKPVLLALATTALGFAGVFATLTYIAPFLTQQTGMPETMISPIMLVFGVGLIIGNILGGKLADRNLLTSLYFSLGGLALCLLLYSFFSTSFWMVCILTFFFGLTGFATVAPLQMDVLKRASHAPTLASAMNIAAFNLGNAGGAWAGGLVVSHEYSLVYVPIVGVGFALSAFLVSYLNRA